MQKLILGTLTICGLIAGISAVASASPAAPLFKADAVQAAQVQNVDYQWNHHRYKHRSWDRRHHRWRYY